MKQYGFYVDSSKCTGCKTCQISCKDEKDLDVGPKYRRVYEYGGGNWLKPKFRIRKIKHKNALKCEGIIEAF